MSYRYYILETDFYRQYYDGAFSPLRQTCRVVTKRLLLRAFENIVHIINIRYHENWPLVWAIYGFEPPPPLCQCNSLSAPCFIWSKGMYYVFVDNAPPTYHGLDALCTLLVDMIGPIVTYLQDLPFAFLANLFQDTWNIINSTSNYASINFSLYAYCHRKHQFLVSLVFLAVVKGVDALKSKLDFYFLSFLGSFFLLCEKQSHLGDVTLQVYNYFHNALISLTRLNSLTKLKITTYAVNKDDLENISKMPLTQLQINLYQASETEVIKSFCGLRLPYSRLLQYLHTGYQIFQRRTRIHHHLEYLAIGCDEAMAYVILQSFPKLKTLEILLKLVETEHNFTPLFYGQPLKKCINGRNIFEYYYNEASNLNFLIVEKDIVEAFPTITKYSLKTCETNCRETYSLESAALPKLNACCKYIGGSFPLSRLANLSQFKNITCLKITNAFKDEMLLHDVLPYLVPLYKTLIALELDNFLIYSLRFLQYFTNLKVLCLDGEPPATNYDEFHTLPFERLDINCLVLKTMNYDLLVNLLTCVKPNIFWLDSFMTVEDLCDSSLLDQVLYLKVKSLPPIDTLVTISKLKSLRVLEIDEAEGLRNSLPRYYLKTLHTKLRFLDVLQKIKIVLGSIDKFLPMTEAFSIYPDYE